MAREFAKPKLQMFDGQIRFFQPIGCEDVFLAGWDRSASAVSMARLAARDPRRLITVQLNGKPARALIDSGAD